jgi:pilus assembly protein CpaB
MKKKLVPLLGIAFVVAIISTGIFYGLFVGRLKSATASGPSIVVAGRALERGATLQPSDVKLVVWGVPEMPAGAMTALSQANGLTLLAAVQENEPILQSRVASRQNGSGAGLGISPGMRAVSIHATDSSGVVSLLRPGHKVDVQLVLTQPSSLPELRTILQDIEVLSVNTTGDNRSNNNPVVTLLINPEGADMAGLGDSAAHLRLVLRNPLDDAQPDLKRVTLPQMLQSAGGPPARTAKK